MITTNFSRVQQSIQEIIDFANAQETLYVKLSAKLKEALPEIEDICKNRKCSISEISNFYFSGNLMSDKKVNEDWCLIGHFKMTTSARNINLLCSKINEDFKILRKKYNISIHVENYKIEKNYDIMVRIGQ